METAKEQADTTPQDAAVRVFSEILKRDPPGPATDNRLEQTNHYRGMIYLAINAIGNYLSGATVRVMQRNAQPDIQSKSARRRAVYTKAMPGQSTEARDHELTEAPSDNYFVKLFEHVNETDTMSDLLMDWTIQQNLTGSTNCWGMRSKLGLPMSLYVLPTALMYPATVSPQYPYGAWRVQPYYPSGAFGALPGILSGASMGGVLLDARDVYRHRMRHPLYRWDGYSPLTAGGVQLDVLEAIDQSRKGAMDHGINPDVMITLQGANEETCKRVEGRFRSHEGSYNHRRVLVSGGMGKVEMLNASPKEMDYSEGWEQMSKVAFALLGVPPAVVGTVEAGSYAQLWASMKQFQVNKAKPFADSIARFLTKNMLRKYDPDLVLQIDLPKIDDEDLLMKQNDQLAKYGGLTVNELRGSYGREPMDGGDTVIGQQQPEEGGDVSDSDTSPDPRDDAAGAGLADDVASVLSASAGPNDVGTITKSFDNQKHPRGNPKNKGEFSSKGGGGGTGGGGMSSGGRAGAGTGLGGMGAPKDIGRPFGATVEHVLSAPFKPLADFIDHIDEHIDRAGDALKGLAKAVVGLPGVAVRKMMRGIQLVCQKYQDNLAATRSAAKDQRWVERMAQAHAPKVAKKLGCSIEEAQALMHASLSATVAKLQGNTVQAKADGMATRDGKHVGYTVSRRGASNSPTPKAGSPSGGAMGTAGAGNKAPSSQSGGAGGSQPSGPDAKGQFQNPKDQYEWDKKPATLAKPKAAAPAPSQQAPKAPEGDLRKNDALEDFFGRSDDPAKPTATPSDPRKNDLLDQAFGMGRTGNSDLDDYEARAAARDDSRRVPVRATRRKRKSVQKYLTKVLKSLS